MRTNKLVLILGVTLLAGLLVMFAGCGSDDDKSTGSTVNYNDPEFLVVQEEVDHFVDSTLSFFNNGLGNIYSLATDTLVDPIYYGPGPGDFDSTKDSASATYNNGWHVIYFSLHRTEYNAIMRDSIQFIKDGQPQQTATDLESMYYRHFWWYDHVDTMVTHTSYSGTSRCDFTGLNTQQATISGSNEMNIHSKFVSNDSTVWRDMTISATLTGITIDKTPQGWAQGCPSSGSISADFVMVYQKGTAAPDTTTWTVSITFTDGSMSAVVSHGGTTWTYDSQICTPPL